MQIAAKVAPLRDVVLGRVFVRAANSLAERPRLNTQMLPSDKVLL